MEKALRDKVLCNDGVGYGHSLFKYDDAMVVTSGGEPTSSKPELEPAAEAIAERSDLLTVPTKARVTVAKRVTASLSSFNDSRVSSDSSDEVFLQRYNQTMTQWKERTMSIRFEATEQASANNRSRSRSKHTPGITIRDLDETGRRDAENELFDVWSPRIIEEGAAAIARPGRGKSKDAISKEALRKNKVVYTGKREGLRLRSEGIPERTDLEIQRLEELGRGAQGTVYRVQIEDMEGDFVDKQADTRNNNIDEASRKCNDMFHEFSLAHQLNHPNIIEYKYFMHTYDQNRKRFEFHTILELLSGGDMAAYIAGQMETFDEDQRLATAKRVGIQLISGLKYLYQQKVIHRDLKPQNVMFSKDHSVVKLIDLGISSDYEVNQAGHNDVGCAGTWRYMSPEQLNGKICLKTDVWAFGCILLELCTGRRPYDGIVEEVGIVGQLSVRFCSPLQHCMASKTPKDYNIIRKNPELRFLLHRCFNFNYIQRPSAYVLENDTFFAHKNAREQIY